LRLLLVNPALPESFWSFRWALEEVLGGKRSLNPPLGLATLAALCPAHWEVTIVDEAAAAIRAVAPEGTDVEVALVWDPPWTPERMSAEAQARFGWT